MNFDGRRIGVAGFAAVLPRVRGLRRLDKEPRGGDVATLLGYHRDAAPGTVVAQNLLIVVPKDVGWRLRAEVYGARQVYRATRANVQVRTSEYRRCRNCDKEPPSLSLPLSFPPSRTSLPTLRSSLRSRVPTRDESSSRGKARAAAAAFRKRYSRERKEPESTLLIRDILMSRSFSFRDQGHCNRNNKIGFNRVALSEIRFTSFSLDDVNGCRDIIWIIILRNVSRAIDHGATERVHYFSVLPREEAISR